MRDNQSKNDEEGEPEPDSGHPLDSRVRLNKFMAELGIASRRKCDEMIVGGKVTVDGQPAVELGTKIDPDNQVVEVGGVILRPLSVRKRYYLLNKPRGVVCTNEPREQRTRAIDLISDRNKGRIFSVGRLDEDSSGLLLLTNDGEFTNHIAHPRHSVPKTYLVKVRGRIDEAALAKIAEGVRLSEGKTSGAAIHVERRATEASVLTVTIREGKNREIRRVFAAMGYKVLRLHRVRIGALSDKRLKDGEWRPLTPEEVADLLHVASHKERAEELFKRAAQGSYARKPSESEGDERPARAGKERASRVTADSADQRSRFGGTRREWHEPKDFRIKSATRKPRFDPAKARQEGERKLLEGDGERGGAPSTGRGASGANRALGRGGDRDSDSRPARGGARGGARSGARTYSRGKSGGAAGGGTRSGTRSGGLARKSGQTRSDSGGRSSAGSRGGARSKGGLVSGDRAARAGRGNTGKPAGRGGRR